MNGSGFGALIGVPAGRYDGHCHVFTADLPMAKERRYTPRYDAVPQSLCEHLRTFGLSGALLIQPSFLGSDNSYLLDCLERLGSESGLVFRGVIVLDRCSVWDWGRLRELGRKGIVGVRLNLFGNGGDFRYGDWRPQLAAIERLGWHIELHVESERLPAILPQLARHHSRIVIDHFGLIREIDANPGLQAILGLPIESTWIKASAAYRIYPEHERYDDVRWLAPLYRIYADRFGPDRIIWGSDWPFTQFEDRMNYARALNVLALSVR